jgi:hypothetical protein
MNCFEKIKGGVSFVATGDKKSGERIWIYFFCKCFSKCFEIFVQIFLGCFITFGKDNGALFAIFIESIDES